MWLSPETMKGMFDLGDSNLRTRLGKKIIVAKHVLTFNFLYLLKISMLQRFWEKQDEIYSGLHASIRLAMIRKSGRSGEQDGQYL
jgi:hypothetical protein